MISYNDWKALVASKRVALNYTDEAEMRSALTWDPSIIAKFWEKHPEEKLVLTHPLTKKVMSELGLVGLALDNEEGAFVFVKSPEIFEDKSVLVYGFYPDIFGMIALHESEGGMPLIAKVLGVLGIASVGLLGLAIYRGKR
jgi:hypothetical protein